MPTERGYQRIITNATTSRTTTPQLKYYKYCPIKQAVRDIIPVLNWKSRVGKIPLMPPVTTKLAPWQLAVFNVMKVSVISFILWLALHETDHYDDVIMDSIASQITSLTIVYSTVHSGADQSKHQSSASLAFVWEIHRWPVNFPHKWPVTRKMFPFDDVIMRMFGVFLKSLL